MNICLSAEQQACIEKLVAAGRFASAEEAFAEGIRLLVVNEEVRQQVQLGIEQADRKELVSHDVVFSRLRMLAMQSGVQE